MSNRIVFKIRPVLDMPVNSEYLNAALTKAREFLVSREIHDVKSLILPKEKEVIQQKWV